ncbi:alpha/beta hydrolase [Cryobacterium sp. TMT1-3]|uniref:Alpha/beta hydrolase n=1 Tax=Cryobacterium luteum TaxID=1424661 RepID=A0A1H8IPK5_9MICO|nr:MULTISPECIES: alpha/beta hydrolase [Cryobacterium]TFB91092.1 alpha/beta hydrolase [Cryobacterium luteum]TFC28196.1 alpha/beta hydrolase [Cryobacterium sp. TMT1-3]SEN70349.1 Pimeloyl-ACP methyl ester carboxylesterase [Cryobacterium luteum]
MNRPDRVRIDGHEFGVQHFPASSGAVTTPVFVIVHGIGTSHRYSVPLQRALAAGHPTYLVDLPGFGGTSTPRHRLWVEDYANLLGALLDTLGVTNSVAIGHSMGAQFVTELAVQRPELVSHVVLIGPVTDAHRRTAVAQAVDLYRDTLKEPVRANAMVFGDYARCGPWWYTKTLSAMLAYATDERIVRLAAPVLVVRGSDDPIARQGWCRHLVRSAPHGRLVEIPGHRHLVHYSAADRVAERIVEFAGVERGLVT